MKTRKTTDNQQELFVVVDKDDNILGHHTRFACHHDKSLIHRGVNLIIFNNAGEVLLQQRSLTKDTYPGYWMNAVGGHLGKDESYETALRRETQEEIGIVPGEMKLVSKFIFYGPRETEMEALFRLTHDGPFFPDSTEVSQVKFFSQAKLRQVIKSGEIKLTDLAEHCLKLVDFL